VGVKQGAVEPSSVTSESGKVIRGAELLGGGAGAEVVTVGAEMGAETGAGGGGGAEAEAVVVDEVRFWGITGGAPGATV